MKRVLVIFLFLLAIGSVRPADAVRAQAPPAGFVIKTLAPGQLTTPDYQVSATEAKRFIPGKWLDIEVEFSAPPPGALELTFKYFVLLNNQLLTGEVTHINVLPGQSLFSVMYVAPHTLAQVLKGQPFSPSAIQNAEVQIVKPGVGAPLASKQLKPGPPLSTSATPQVPGMMLNKNDTPFAPLYWDRYEMIKAAK